MGNKKEAIIKQSSSNCCSFIFCVEKVSSQWVPDPVPFGEGGQLEARPVAAHPGVDAPRLLIYCEHVAVGACSEKWSPSYTWEMIASVTVNTNSSLSGDFSQKITQICCCIRRHFKLSVTWSLGRGGPIVRHQDLSVPVLALAQLLARKIHHKPVQPLGGLRVGSEKCSRFKLDICFIFQDFYCFTNLLGASGSIMARV